MNNNNILQGLSSKDPIIRIQTIISLKNAGEEKAAAMLVPYLNTDNSDIRQTVISTLLEIGKSAIPYLVSGLKSTDITIQKNSVRILSEIADISISAELVNLLKDENEYVRAATIEVLNGIKDFWSLAYIREFVTDPAPVVRVAAVRALGDFEDKLSIDLLLSLLSDSENSVKIAAIEALAKFNEPRICDALWHINLKDEDTKIKDAAFYSLKKIGDMIIKPYEEFLSSNDIELRAKALNELSSMGKAVLLPMLECSKHHNPVVRAICTEILGNIKDSMGVQRLIELTDDFEQSVRVAAIESLGKIKSETALRFLISCLQNPEPVIVTAASQALASCGEEIIKFLPDLISAQDLNTQITLSRFIGKIADSNIISILAERINDNRMWIRRAICFALGETKNPLAGSLLTERCLFDRDTLVRTAATQGLGKLKMSIFTDTLVNALQDDEESVQIAAINALTEIGDTNTGSYLLRFLTNKSVMLKISACRALAKLSYIGAIPLLKKMARSWPFGNESEEVKNEAQLALKKLTYEAQANKPQ